MERFIGRLADAVREQSPLVHCITNYVTANDCANVLLACGASPIMADEEKEAREITSICDGLVINMGTLNEKRLLAMLAAGKAANEKGIPAILDPVGVGASSFRREALLTLLKEVHFSIIKGNISEIKTVFQLSREEGIPGIDRKTAGKKVSALGAGEKGVDANVCDAVTKESLPQIVSLAKRLCEQAGAAVVVTGAADLAVSGEAAYVVRNGCPMMARITGSGCMLAALMGAYAAAANRLFSMAEKPGVPTAGKPDREPGIPMAKTAARKPVASMAKAAAAALVVAGECGEAAAKKVQGQGLGTGSFRIYFMDEISRIAGREADAWKKLDYIPGARLSGIEKGVESTEG